MAEPPRVAVIAVHGIADQQPGDTGTAIAGLLANLQTTDGTPAYSTFRGEELRLPVRRLEVPPHVTPGELFAHRARSARAAAGGNATHDVGLEFMATLLAAYEVSGPEETYETTRLSGRRVGGPQVDVYEMYWADLSRLTQSVFRIFADIYQLLFHLGSLGVHAVSAAQMSETAVGHDRSWTLWVRMQRLGANLLALYVVELNLFLLGLVLVLTALHVLAPVTQPAVVTLAGAGAAAAAGYWTYSRYKRRKHVGPAAILVAGIAVVLGVVMDVAHLTMSPAVADAALTTELGVLVALGLYAVIRLYNRHRPGAARVALLLGVPIGVMLLRVWRLDTPTSAALLDVGALACLAMAVAWIVFFVAGWSAYLVGRLLVWRADTRLRDAKAGSPAHEAARHSADRIRRTEWTARLTLSGPAALFVMTTTVLWWAVWTIGQGYISAEPAPDTWMLSFFGYFLAKSTTVSLGSAPNLIHAVIAASAGWGFGVLVACLTLAAVVAIYGVAASVLTEVFPPGRTKDGTALGRWLDDGFRRMRLGGHLLHVAVFVVLPVGLAALMTLDRGLATQWATFNVAVLMYASAALLPAAAGLMAFSKRLKALTLGLRNTIDALLDVDNYLREHPQSATPRARIAARYTSLLRYVYTQGYDKIIIVAHSQGTVITADLLRFIEAIHGAHPELMAGLNARATSPITLFTMGSPLRQLYGLRFPHLYAWARHTRDGPRPSPLSIPPHAEPRPRELGVGLWVNAYRSGDYVGRYLWSPDDDDRAYGVNDERLEQPWIAGPPAGVSESVDGPPTSRVEFCIGAGAHTHYWDRTAPSIARKLDQLIQ